MIKKHILIIDDEADFAETLAVRLQLRGYKVTVVHNGQEGLEKAKERPEIILLDVTMPGMSGYEVCNRLRQNEATKSIPIVMFTAKEMAQDRIEGLQMGADDYIPKSSDAEELFMRIEALLRRSGFLKRSEKDKAAIFKGVKSVIQKETMEMNFQPIIDLKTMQTFGYEILTRCPKDSRFSNPEELFKQAFNCGMLFELEMVCRKKALIRINEAPEDMMFFINTGPYLIESEKFENILALYDKPDRIVLEITERSEIMDFEHFRRSINTAKEKGFRIAIDDVGSGYSSLDVIAELEPHFVKIDIGLVRGINTIIKKQSIVKSILLFCRESNVGSIAEGIETEEELKKLVDLGVMAAQGYFLGKPAPELK